MTPSHRSRQVITGAVLALALAAGGSTAAAFAGRGSTAARAGAGSDHRPVVQHVTLAGTNSLRFSPSTVHVHVGAVRVALVDSGAYPHDIVVPSLHVTSPTVTGDPGGTRVSFTVRFPRAGRYPFHCQYHQSAGMVGVFVAS